MAARGSSSLIITVVASDQFTINDMSSCGSNSILVFSYSNGDGVNCGIPSSVNTESSNCGETEKARDKIYFFWSLILM